MVFCVLVCMCNYAAQYLELISDLLTLDVIIILIDRLIDFSVWTIG